MDIPKNSEALKEGSLVSELGQVQNPCDKTLEKGLGWSSLSEECIGFSSASELLSSQNGGGLNFTGDNMDMGNGKITNRFMLGEGQEEHLLGKSAGPMKVDSLKSEYEGKRLVVPSINGMSIGDVSVLDRENYGNEEVGVEKIVKYKHVEDGIASQLHWDDSAKKIEVSGDSLSLFVEVFGPLNGIIEGDDTCHVGGLALNGTKSDHENEDEGSGQLLPGNGENSSATNPEIHEGLLEVEGGDIGDQEFFPVGDLVWVKTKTESWLPGRIDEPSPASKDVEKPHQRNCVLVKYFTNGDYVWCPPSQIKPFLEHFEQMSMQCDTRNFLIAVELAVGVCGQHVKIQMSCSCFSNERGTKLATLLPAEAKEGDLVSETNTVKLAVLSATRFEPEAFVTFIKCLSQDVSKPGMIELTVNQNLLWTFYHSGLTSGEKDENLIMPSEGHSDIGLQRHESGVAEERILSSDMAVESSKRKSNGGDEGEEMASLEGEKVCPAIDPKARKGRVFKRRNGNGWTRVKNDRGSRERKRSKYLSPPFVNLSAECKTSPTSEEHRNSPKDVSHFEVDNNSPASQSVGSIAIVNSGGMRSRKKQSTKPITGHDVSNKLQEINLSSSELLSELCLSALDCFYPDKNRHFDSVERFFSGFRRSTFHDECNNEMAGVPTVFEQEPSQANELSSCTGSAVKNSKAKKCYSSSNGVPKKRQRRKRGTASGISETTPTVGLSGANGNDSSMIINFLETEGIGVLETTHITDLRDTPGNNSTSGSVVINFQQTMAPAPNAGSKKKVIGSPLVPQTNVVTELPDLNGNSSLSVEDMQITGPVLSQGKLQPKKRKRNEGAVSEHVQINSARFAPFLKDMQVVGIYSLQSSAELNTKEKMNEAASQCLNAAPPSRQLYFNGSKAVPSSLVNEPQQMGRSFNCNNVEPSFLVNGSQQMDMPFPCFKPERKKRKRKLKASDSLANNVPPAIPDLNGNVPESSSIGKELPGTNCISPEGKPQRKRGRRKKADARRQVINVNYREVPTCGVVLGTALLLNFAPGTPLPSREVLVATFCPFGQLRESETKVTSDGIAMVVFSRSSDAANAIQSLEKTNPFGPALVSYRLHNLSPSATTHAFQPRTRLKTTAIPSVLKPHKGEAPDLLHVRQNLEMMRSMLEKSGNNLSPEMRAKLESEIKGLLTKVTTMVGPPST